MRLLRASIVLPFQKGAAPDKAIEIMHPISPLRIPLCRSDDGVPTVLPAENSTFSAGDLLYAADNEVPVYATINGAFAGTVVLNHPQYGGLLCAEIHPDEEQPDPIAGITEVPTEPDDIIRIARDAAIYDELDGVPLCEKLAAWQLPANDTAAVHSVLVADATENDVFGSSAWAVLDKDPRTVLNGLQFAARATNFSRYHIAAMLPKAKQRKLRNTIDRINIHIVSNEYPITDYTGDRSEAFRIGVQACVALSKAVRQNEKHLGAVVTVAGDGVPSSRNLRVPFGTDIEDILTYCHACEDAVVILGDAMNGIPCPNTHMPLLPGNTTILVLKPRTIKTPQPCMGCGRCAAVCHAQLLPYEIVRRLENMHYERLQHLSPWECDGCAACSYVCPAGRNVADDVMRAAQAGGTIFFEWGENTDG